MPRIRSRPNTNIFGPASTPVTGSARYSVAAGRAGSVRIRLTRAGLATLRKKRKLRVNALAKGSGGTVGRTIVLRAPSR